MSLVTRCPACGTTFKASPEQLSARRGRVRCGKCASVFDGVANLLADQVAAVATEPGSTSAVITDAGPRDEPPQGETASLAMPVATDRPNAVAEPPPAPAIESPEIAALADVASDAPAKQRSKRRRSNEPATPEPAFLKPARSHAGHPAFWGVLGFILLCALGLQAALHFRSELAVLLPAARIHLETFCDVLGCDLRLPRRADLMSIESSDLQADGQRPGVIVLNALLRNRAPFTQEYPDLELTLTDQGDRPVIRRVLRPSDYLQDRRGMTGRGLAGGGEESVRIRLEAAGIVATGYQLFLFYSCPPPPASAFWQLSYPSRCQNSRP